ncbi:MAG: hypothetical protein ACP5JW_03360 [Candidatus Bathyarchaeia archaeon]
MRVKFEKETYNLSIPRSRRLKVFFATFVIFGLVEAHWLAYPLFVRGVSETLSRMGFVLALSGVAVFIITFLVNWLSDIKMRRVEFTIIGVF